MLPIQNKIKSINCYQGGNNPRYIVIHETDNYSKGAGAYCHGMAHYNGNLSTSVHYYVDDHSIVQTLRHCDGAWAVGDGHGKYGITNRNTINIEICVNPDNNYEKSRLNAVELVKYLMKSLGIPASRVVRHWDASRKCCPRKMINDSSLWNDFKNRISGSVSSNVSSTSSSNSNKNISGKKGYVFNVTTSVNVRKMPGGDIVGTLKNKTDLILDRWDGDWIYIQKPIKGCIYRKYVHILNNTSTIHSTSSTKVLGKCTPTTELNVRTGAGTNFDKIGMVYPNGELILQEKKDNWYKISYTTYSGTTKTGWVSGNYIRML